MNRWLSTLAVSGVLAATMGIAAQQVSPPRTITASVAVTTSDDRRAIAVFSKGEPAFLFCIDLPTPLPEKITYTGGGARRLPAPPGGPRSRWREG